MQLGTTVENLLRVARSDAGARSAFIALVSDDGPPQIVAVPGAGSPDGLSPEELEELVREASADPEFPHARVFVRSVQLGRSLTLAIAPLRERSARSMIGIVAEPDRQFEPAQLDVLERLAQRLLRHFQVVRQLNGGGAARGAGEPPERPPAPEEGEPGTRAERLVHVGAGAGTAAATAEVPDAVPVASPYAPPSIASVPEPGIPRAGATGGWGTATAERPVRDAGGSLATSPPTARVTSPPTARVTSSPTARVTSPATVWATPDALTGLPSIGEFFSRAGRMLALEGRMTGALALVVVEVAGESTAPVAAQALRGQIRFGDPVARVDRDLLAAAVLLFPSTNGDAVEGRVASAVGSALGREVAVSTVVAQPGDRREVDELLREAVSRLPGR